MGFPAIFYNSKTIQFPYGVYDIQLEYPHHRISNRSASLIPEILNVTPDIMHQVKSRLFENSKYGDLKRNVYQWWEWAIQGGAWQYALDSTHTVQTNLFNGVNAGLSTITVVSTAGIVIGNQYVIRNRVQQTVVKVTNIAGTTLTLAEPLDFQFVGGSRFRDEMYWPALLYIVGTGQQAPQHAIREKPPLHFDVELVFTEDVTVL